MRRRDFIQAIAVSTWPLAARAQQSRTRVIGVLWPGTTPPASPRMESFRQGLREAGMIEGPDFRIELRYAQDGPQHFPELVAELVGMKVDVISPAGDFALRIAQQATSTIPIVANSDDMLGMGLIRGLKAEAAAGFQSRRERCREPTPVAPQYAAFPTYKAARVRYACLRGRSRIAAGGARATADDASDRLSQLCIVRI